MSFFFDSIAGSGKRPETWATIVSCLKFAELNYYADTIVEQYDDSPGTPPEPTTTPPEPTTTPPKPTSEA